MGQLQQWTFTDPVTANGSSTHFVRHISVTPVTVDPVTVTEAPCERGLTIVRIFRFYTPTVLTDLTDFTPSLTSLTQHWNPQTKASMPASTTKTIEATSRWLIMCLANVKAVTSTHCPQCKMVTTLICHAKQTLGLASSWAIFSSGERAILVFIHLERNFTTYWNIEWI